MLGMKPLPTCVNANAATTSSGTTPSSTSAGFAVTRSTSDA